MARAAIDAGADIVNDVSGGAFDPDMLPTVADLHVPFVIMHMRGTPETMQSMTQYHDVVMEVASSLQEQSRRAEMAGENDKIILLMLIEFSMLCACDTK